MANQTITANTNYDDASISGLLNGENVAINGGVLTLDSDIRHAQQAAVVGSMDISATLGGGILIDGTKVWQIEFDASTGNVPTLGTVGTQNCTGGTSGATGEFLGVWATYPAIPNAAGGAMPTTGLVKFRSKVGTFLDNEVVTLPGGATVTINSATGGRRSWIEIAAESGNNPAIPRLGSLVTQGDWFELGTTNGTDDQTFDLPVLDSLPAFWMETSVGSGVYEQWLNAGCKWGTATQFVATDLRGKYFGQWREQAGNATNASAVVTMASTAGFNVRGAVQNTNTATAATLVDGVCINSIVANTSVTLSSNATATAAVTFRSIDSKVTIARRASNSCGFKPISGLRVRIPNVWLSNTNTQNYAANVLHATSASRYEITATAAGVIDLKNCVCNWYLNTQNCYSLNVENFAQGCAGGSLFNIGNSPTLNTITNAAWGIEGLLAANPIAVNNAFAGATFTDCRASRAWGGDNGAGTGTTGTSCISFSDSADITMIDCQAEQFENSNGTTTHANSDKRNFVFTRVAGITLTRPVCIGGEFNFADASNITVTDPVWGDNLSTTTQTTNGLSVAAFSSFSSGCFWTGLEWFGGGTIANIHPYDYLFVLSSQCFNNRFRNIGTPAVPLAIGTNATSGICSVVQSTDNEFNRIYISDHRTALANASSSAYRTRVDNCWAGTVSGGYIPSNDTRLRGVRETMFTTGQNAIYGAHWADMFTGTTTGRLVIAANEPSAASAAQCYITAGTPKFTGTGSVSMPAIGDRLVWEMDYLMLGYTAFANIAPTITGTLTTNMSYEFQWSTGGAWNGTWLTLDAATLSGLAAINPVTGIKLKVRATTVTADATNAITFIRIDLVTDATSQLVVYPFKTDAAITVGPIISGTRVRIYNETTDTEIYNAIPDGTSLTFAYNNGVEISAGDELSIRVRKKEYTREIYAAIASATGASVLTSQTLTPFYDGIMPSDYTVDFVNKKIRATGTRDEFTLAEIADIIAIEQSTQDGIRLPAFANISGLTTLSSGVQIAITVELLDWQISWASGSVSQAYVTGGNLVGGILSDPIEDVVGGPQVTINLSASATVVAGSGTAPTAAEVAAAVRVELATELARIDAAISSRNAVAPLDSTATQAAAASALTAYDGPTKAELDSAVAPLALEATVATKASQASVNAIPTTPLLAASYTAPDNASIALILADTNELQTNQGAWATATGFATPVNVADARDVVTTAISGLNDFDPAVDIVARVTLVDTTTTNSDMRGTDGAITSLSGIATSANVTAAIDAARIDANIINENVQLASILVPASTDLP